jgi:hypothetical protein
VVSGYSGIPGLKKEGLSFFRCRFKVKNGVAELDDYAIGWSENKTAARLCGLGTS